MQFKEILFPELDKMGYENVKEKYNSGNFKEEKVALVKEWLNINASNTNAIKHSGKSKQRGKRSQKVSRSKEQVPDIMPKPVRTTD